MDLFTFIKLSALLLTLCALYHYIVVSKSRSQSKAQHGCQPCRVLPVKDPIFASDQIIALLRAFKNKKALEDRKKLVDYFGNTYVVKSLTQMTFYTSEPENIKAMLSTKFPDYQFDDRTHTHYQLLGEGIFAVSGKKWVESRALLRPNFAREQVADIATFETHIQKLFELIPTDGRTVDLQDLFYCLTMDSATEFLFGSSIHSLGMKDVPATDPIAGKFSNAFYVAGSWVGKRTIMGPLARFVRSKDETEALKVCHTFIDRFVEDAVQYRERLDRAGEDEEHGQEHKRYIFLQELAKATTDKKRLRDEILNILLAGRDTTAGMLSNLFFMLAKRPDVWSKLRADVESLDGKLPTYKDLQELKYVRYCLNECMILFPATDIALLMASALRTHSVVPANKRTAMRDTFLPVGGGDTRKSPVFVPKGANVILNIDALHRRKDIWGADADEFKPERWETWRPGWEYSPFSGGPRTCIGQQYALTEAAYVTVRLAQQYKTVESRDDGPWVEGYSITLCSGNGTKVALRTE
ncbi:cytochrome P450 52A12 [Rhizodiscina lignyota]|uniref:Cytochrome P450 52A12 n=1 Tax=Rhizodiscina lignyota TaxID=1504668 RepID=A0A9P4M1B4_9PEZI|nr:cytochrome P450 52A12 [Rhizodiscina lignyota]